MVPAAMEDTESYTWGRARPVLALYETTMWPAIRFDTFSDAIAGLTERLLQSENRRVRSQFVRLVAHGKAFPSDCVFPLVCFRRDLLSCPLCCPPHKYFNILRHTASIPTLSDFTWSELEADEKAPAFRYSSEEAPVFPRDASHAKVNDEDSEEDEDPVVGSARTGTTNTNATGTRLVVTPSPTKLQSKVVLKCPVCGVVVTSYHRQDRNPLPLTVSGVVDWYQQWPLGTDNTRTATRNHFEIFHPAVVFMPCGIKLKYKKRSIVKLPDGNTNFAEYKRMSRSEKKLPKKLPMKKSSPN
jgi:hypothetical protein